MKIEQTVVIKICISDVIGLDPITVILDDIEESKGRLTLVCFDTAWTCYFGNMGPGVTLIAFILRCPEEYLVDKLSPPKSTRAELIYLHKVITAVKSAIKQEISS